jgi:two-component system, NarL family, invasion response regulator UvrY
MDISMPGRGGIDALEHIREFDAHARVLVFTMQSGAAYALQAFRAGAKGYVTKSSSPDVLAEAVKPFRKVGLRFAPKWVRRSLSVGMSTLPARCAISGANMRRGLSIS